MNLETNIKLAPLTTFHIGGEAKYFVRAHEVADITAAVAFANKQKLPIFALGGGSNILISDNGFNGVVIHVANDTIVKVKETNDEVHIIVGGGAVWDEVVTFAVENNFWGIENLSHIPGRMGGVPVQNVGAYGQEASQVIEEVQAYEVATGAVKTLSNTECNFGYRSSIFNREGKGKYIILFVTIKLHKAGSPNTSYGDVAKYFSATNTKVPSIRELRQAIIKIRNRKFPYPDSATRGSAGSFFKADTIPESEFSIIINKIAESFGSEAAQKLENMKDKLTVAQGVKIPYGYLIELCGLKGHGRGSVKICETHAGVILNFTGRATALEVLDLFRYIRQTVYDKTGVLLQNEPEFIGFTDDVLAPYFGLQNR